MSETVDLIQLADRYGLPLVFLCFGTLLVVWAVRAVWGFFKPLASRTADSLMNLIQKQSDFIDTVSEHQNELKELVAGGQSGHDRTHAKLDAVHKDVLHIRDKFKGNV